MWTVFMLGVLYLYLELKNQLVYWIFLNQVLFSFHVRTLLCPIKLALEINSSVSTSENSSLRNVS